jgi:hypothetical protein
MVYLSSHYPVVAAVVLQPDVSDVFVVPYFEDAVVILLSCWTWYVLAAPWSHIVQSAIDENISVCWLEIVATFVEAGTPLSHLIESRQI